MDLCGPMPTESQGGNKYFLSIIDDYSRKVTVFPIRNKSDVFHTFIRFQKRAERFLSKRQKKVNSNLGYNLNLPDYNDDEDDFDRVKDSLTSRLVSKTSTETPSTSEKPGVSSDNHNLIPCTEVKWIRNIDSDFATNRDDRVSMGGFITFIDETPISWRTFKQKSVSLSTMEAEYVSLTEAAKEFIWLKNVIDNKSLNLELSENVMFCDNQAAISFQSHQ
ncbi:retrovirus-related Pol polyprotein from transposon TNT 1-94 [Trichonephila clavipes]|nr:retrovirus-related Pol polyprotein from transposon TNT 1-94 [Trichonephila clavipes]